MALNQIMFKKLKSLTKDVFASIFFCAVPRLSKSVRLNEYGINFIGYAKAELGQGEALRSLVLDAEHAGLPLIVRDFEPHISSRQGNMTLSRYFSRDCSYALNCIGINPDQIFRLPFWLKYREWGCRYNIGYWFWELSNYPKAWLYAKKIVDEIWVNSDFVAEAMAQTGKRVVKIPFCVEFEEPSEKIGRKHFSLPATKFLFLFSYDFLSTSIRKNPEAVIKAFHTAFPPHVEDVGLVVKSVNGNQCAYLMDGLRRLASENRRIQIIDEYLTTDEMRALINCCDSYVSLHRSEGLGLGMAEAMYLGKPVIATAYSGNMEFMNEHNSCLVNYRLVSLSKGDYFNTQSQVWAEPNIESAASWMRWLYENRQEGERLGKAAANHMRRFHSRAIAGEAIKRRVNEIFAEQVARHV